VCVNNSITKEDLVYIKKFLNKGQVQPLLENPTYEDEVEFIRAVQNAVLNLVPNKSPLPYFKPREPKDIYKAKGEYGACCDRSRLIEKILRKHRFKTRHVFIYSKNSFGGKPLSFFWKCLCFFCAHVKTHSVSEVLTKEGWLVIDSNSNWVSLDKQNYPHSMKDIECGKQIFWKEPMCSQANCSDMKDICEGFFTFLYGVYSRRGRLYPPFIFCFPKHDIKFCIFPDVNCCELLYNFPFPKKVKDFITQRS